jgi:uncharacterized protein YndB with AHSA1/START domain
MTMDKTLKLAEAININATAAEVWNALTNKELIKEYFCGTETNTDWKEGSPISFTGTWEGKTYEDKGTVLKVEKEKLLQHDYWSSFWGNDVGAYERSVITYEISGNRNTETTLTVKQEGFKDASSPDHSISNWQGILKNIKKLLEKQ